MDEPTILDKSRPRPTHAVTQNDLDAITTHLSSFETEDGFPCAHRRLRKFFVVQGLTWTKIWESYCTFMENKDPPVRVLSRGR